MIKNICVLGILIAAAFLGCDNNNIMSDKKVPKGVGSPKEDTKSSNDQCADGFVQVKGTQIIDAKGNPLYFNGINLGNWLLWEGYLMMGDFNYGTHTQFLDKLEGAFGNRDRALDFQHQWRLNYVDEKSIADLKNLGFNSVRVPFSYKIFWNNGAVSDQGFEYIDRLIKFSKKNNMYILLDMHAAPGHQNPGDHSDNNDSNANQPRDTVKFWDGDSNIKIASQVWKHIAARYKDEPVIWGYDLINEPVPQPDREYELLPSLITMRNAIREVDTNHIIVAEGSWWSSELDKIDWTDPKTQAATGIKKAWDSNLVYQTHHYGPAADTVNRHKITNNMGIPLILGEYGERDNGDLAQMTTWAQKETSGHFPWSFKKMSHDKTLWTIPPNDDYSEFKNLVNNGGASSVSLYNKMITFAQTNIKNGHASHEWHKDFYEAVKPIAGNTGNNGGGAGANLAPTAKATCIAKKEKGEDDPIQPPVVPPDPPSEPTKVSNNKCANGFVQAKGTQIIDEKGNLLYFNGINLGNWLLWEGYLMMGDFNYGTHTQFLDKLQAAFGNKERALDFQHQWRLNYVDEKSIADLKNLGFNSVRVPFSYKLFWNNGAVADQGFEYIDRLIKFSKKNNMYILLDMHAAPGHQNPGDHSDNNDSNANQPRDTVKFWDGDSNIKIASQVWKHIAVRYKDEPVIWGYDLINEPVPQPDREYELLPSLIAMGNAIREVDTNHIIVAEGSWWSSELDKIDWTDPKTQAATGIKKAWDSNLVYQTHHYGPAAGTVNRHKITNNMGIPLILGEYGESENGNLAPMTAWAQKETSGHFPWSFKKMSHDKTLWTIPPNDDYNEFKNLVNSGGEPSVSLYNKMITFAQTNIKNGHASHEWHKDFYEAVKPIAGNTGNNGGGATSTPDAACKPDEI